MIKRLGIIAGKGQLPISIAQSARKQGYQIYVIGIEGLADKALAAYPGMAVNLGHIGGAINALRAANCEAVVFAGYITRPDFTTIRFDETGQNLFPRIAAAAGQGDDAAMSVFIAIFQEAGFQVLGAEAIYQDLLCPEGLLTEAAANNDERADLDKAFHIAGIIGREDIGQGCIVCDGIVIAVEAQEGTDAMLVRAGGLDLAYRVDSRIRKGVLVKRAKPDQERRIDLPTIGPQTVLRAAEAGLAGIGLEAGASLIIDREATVAAANRAGLFLIGMAAGDPG